MVFERVGELSGDAADDARIDELGRTDPVATPASARRSLPRTSFATSVRRNWRWRRLAVALPLARSIAAGAASISAMAASPRASSRPADAS